MLESTALEIVTLLVLLLGGVFATAALYFYRALNISDVVEKRLAMLFEAVTNAVISVEFGTISEDEFQRLQDKAAETGRNWKMEYALERAEEAAKALGVRIETAAPGFFGKLLSRALVSINTGAVVDYIERVVREQINNNNN